MLVAGVAALEVKKDVQVLARGEQIEQDIVLRADAHELSHLLHILEQVHIVNFCAALRLLDEASEHGDDSGLACTVVAKQGEDLTLEHLEVHAFNGSEASGERLLQAFDLQIVAGLF